MAKLTVRALDAAKPKAKPYKLTADKGLYLRVATDGEKRWLVKYTVDGKQREARLPKPYGNGAGLMSLADAVIENVRIQSMAREGLDFQVERERAKALEQAAEALAKRKNLTVRDLYDVWIKDGVNRKDGNAALKRLIEKDALPHLGAIPLRKLSEADIREVYRKVIERGVQRTAVDLSNSIGQMMRWADKRQPWRALLADGNPAELVDVKKMLSHDYTEERDRVLSTAEIRELRDIFAAMREDYDNAPNKYEVERPVIQETQCALWICLATLCRIGERLLAEWAHVDLDRREWFIPAENTKAHRLKKQDQVVYLSDFALRQFKKLKEITGESKWLFPAANREEGHVCTKSVSKQVGDRQIQFKKRKELKRRINSNSLVLSEGANGEWTPHDLRRTGATMMQSLGVPLEVIDRCQNHIIAGAKVRRHYMHYEYAAEKAEAWKKLGERIDAILSADNVYELRGTAA